MYKLETGGEPVKGTGGTTIIDFDGAPAHIMHFGCVSTPDGPWCGWLPDWDGTLTFTIKISEP